jgi:hypothetical protein
MTKFVPPNSQLLWQKIVVPEGTTTLDLTNFRGLASLPENLPDSITILYLANCSGLTSLPKKLPANLTMLDLNGCYNLLNSPALVRQLT